MRVPQNWQVSLLLVSCFRQEKLNNTSSITIYSSLKRYQFKIFISHWRITKLKSSRLNFRALSHKFSLFKKHWNRPTVWWITYKGQFSRSRNIFWSISLVMIVIFWRIFVSRSGIFRSNSQNYLIFLYYASERIHVGEVRRTCRPQNRSAPSHTYDWLIVL